MRAKGTNQKFKLTVEYIVETNIPSREFSLGGAESVVMRGVALPSMVGARLILSTHHTSLSVDGLKYP